MRDVINSTENAVHSNLYTLFMQSMPVGFVVLSSFWFCYYYYMLTDRRYLLKYIKIQTFVTAKKINFHQMLTFQIGQWMFIERAMHCLFSIKSSKMTVIIIDMICIRNAICFFEENVKWSKENNENRFYAHRDR